MENLTTWRYCRLSSPALDRIELIGGKSLIRIIAVHFHSIRHRELAGSRRLAGFVRGVPPCVGSLSNPR
jgi:hypothetical protein